MANLGAKETALASPPSDGISCLRFSPADPSKLLAASWDGGVRVYETSANSLRATAKEGTAPVLDACFSADGQSVFAAGLDRTVRM